ncbi:DUF4402 domain-containing protein [Brevundimonas guildfordensis]|jgi:hypothetical protein|uniref:DUF4402 domain-containing protein n=1 Tax=Brevundimonas guildfordensis TaxID=2762241 RepID=A0ABR8R1C1_9CAUL|nr:DUF4402 domain-containing protein [Brevundimonas guildfordensis]MBD7941584.1 DUF4402 domain-containing protein [Brevundimonas guildfordensis]
MKLMRLAFPAVAAVVLSVPQGAVAEPVRSTLSVVRSLSIASVRPIQLAHGPLDRPLGVSAEMPIDAPAVIQIAGDPGRVYRIRAPQALVTARGETVLDDLRLWSANTGEVSSSRAGRMDANGRDVLYVTGRLTAAGTGRASLPISIAYE